jgi:hypothetical protein
MYKSTTFKGFKRSGNHLIIFNILNNIVGDAGLARIKSLVHFSHENKIIYCNCLEHYHLEFFKDIFSKERSDSRIQRVIDFVDDPAYTAQIFSLLNADIDDSYQLFFSMEDASLLLDEREYLDELLGMNNYNNTNVLIARDILNMYASRKKTEWMGIGQSFIDDYLYFHKYNADADIIKFNSYLIDAAYRKEIHANFGIDNDNIVGRDVEFAAGNSSYDNSDGVLERYKNLDAEDRKLLNTVELNNITLELFNINIKDLI